MIHARPDYIDLTPDVPAPEFRTSAKDSGCDMSNRPSENFSLLHRYVLILQLLAKRPEVTSTDIREHLADNGHEVGIRTVNRAIEDMRAIGIIDWKDNRENGKRRPVYSLSQRSPVRAAA